MKRRKQPDKGEVAYQLALKAQRQVREVQAALTVENAALLAALFKKGVLTPADVDAERPKPVIAPTVLPDPSRP